MKHCIHCDGTQRCTDLYGISGPCCLCGSPAERKQRQRSAPASTYVPLVCLASPATVEVDEAWVKELIELRMLARDYGWSATKNQTAVQYLAALLKTNK